MLKVPEEVREDLTSMGIETKIEKTKRACEVYNELKDKRKTGACFHLTC